LQPGDRLPQEPPEGAGLRIISEGSGTEAGAHAHSRRAGEVRAPRPAVLLLPAARSRPEPGVRPGSLPAAVPAQQQDRRAELKPGRRPLPPATVPFLLLSLLAPVSLQAQPAPRDQTRLDASDYVARGFEYAARPRPEDQDEAARLFRKALDQGADRAEAHSG